MMLKVSNNKKRPALGLLRSTLAKNIGVIVLMSLAMIIFCPGIFLTVLGRMDFKAQDYFSPEILDAFYSVTMTVSVMLVCVCNFVNFSYLYKKSSSDVFHSLPLTRTGLLVSRFAAGIIEVLIPVTIGYISLLVLSAIYPSYVVGAFSQIVSAYIINVLFILAMSAFSIVFIICAGSAFDLVLSFFGYNVAVLITGGVIHGLCNNYLSGYDTSYTGILRTLSPVYFLGEKAIKFAYEWKYSLSFASGTVLAAIWFAVLFFVISALLYNYRKAERSEQAYAYKFIYIICAVLAGICGGYALSEIFVMSADTKAISVIGIVSFILGAIITTVVYGAVTERGFKKFKKSILLGGISSLIYGIVAVIVITGAFGFEKRMPDEKKIASVTVSFDDATVDFNDAQYALALHKAIIERKADDEYKDTVDTPHTYVNIIYNLDSKGDKVFTREYYVDKEKVKKELFAIYSSENRFERLNNIIDRATNNRVEIWGGYSFDGEEISLDGRITKAQAKELLDVYKRELKAAGEDILKEENETTGSVASITMYVENEESFNIYTTKDFPETNDMLLSLQLESIEIEE